MGGPTVETLTDTSEERRAARPSLANLLFGRPLASDEDSEERIGVARGLPLFGLDALGSAAYGPEAALTVLLPLGAAGVAYSVPMTLAILVLLAIVFFSYRQTIAAYPTGGGSYTVARQNLGASVGLLAGAALMLDYLLNVAVGISTGVGALVSAAPSLQPHTLSLCLGLLAAITVINLRGVREAGLVFMTPTYLFIACLLATMALGVGKVLTGHAAPIVTPPAPHRAMEAVGAWLLIRAFASGCTAMTGVEAVSNGVQAFHEPVAQTARRTLTVIIAILMVLLSGVAFLARAYGIGATRPGEPGYESVLSQLTGAVAGKGWFYYVTMGSILLVLALSANTSFAAFPRLCRTMAQNGYLPYGFAARGRRLVPTFGVYSLALLAALLLIVFGGVTDRLIPLFAIGAFLSFTLSQAGMVSHWRKHPGPGSRSRLAVNALGAVATGLTAVVVAVAKFTEGAWITLALLPAVLLVMAGVRRHYHRVAREVSSAAPLEIEALRPPLVVVPIEEWNQVAKKALRFAMTLSDDVQALHVDSGEEPASIVTQWDEWVAEPALRTRRTPPKLVVVKSPYRFVVGPILAYVRELQRTERDRHIAVVVSELVERRWYQYLLHNQRAQVLTAMLMVNGNDRVAVINVPWYLRA